MRRALIVEEVRTTVSAHKVDDVEFFGFPDEIGQLLRVFPKGCLILKERRAIWIIFEVLNRGLVQRRFAASRRSYGDVGMRSQDIVGVSELRLTCSQLAGFAVVLDECSLGTIQSFSQYRQCGHGR